MRVLEINYANDGDLGVWRDFMRDPTTGRATWRYRIRRVPAEERRRFGRQFPNEKDAIKLNCAVAAYAVTDSDGGEMLPDETEPRLGCEVRLGAAAAKAYTQAAGFHVPPGEWVCFDGKWTDALRLLFLRDDPKTCDWINREAWALEVEGEKAEAKKG